MSIGREPQFGLLWKGRQSGPFSLETIREKLGSGEVSRMHQIYFKDHWMMLGEFLEKHAGNDPTALRQAALEKRRKRFRREFEGPDSIGSQPIGSQFEGEKSLSHLLPPPPQPEEPPMVEPEPPAEAHEQPRPNPLAVASLVLALCNFIPYLNFVTWIGALVCGHLALLRIKHDPALKGRPLAIAALLITYFLLVMVFTLAVLMLAHHQPLF